MKARDYTVFIIILLGILSFVVSMYETLGWTTLQKRTLVIAFPEVKGLKEGASVTLLGMQVGEVKYIEFPEGRNESQTVRVFCEVLGNWSMREGYSASVTSRGLIAIPFVDLNPGYGTPLTNEEEQNLTGDVNPNTAANLTESFSGLRQDIRSGLSNAEESLLEIERGGGFGQALAMYEERDVLQSRLEELSESLPETLQDLRDLRAGEGFLGEALSSDSQYIELREGIADVNERIADLLGDDSWAFDEVRGESLAISLRNAAEFLADANGEDGRFAEFLRAAETADEWRGNVAELRGDIGTIVAGGNGFGELLETPGFVENLGSGLAETREQLSSVLAEVRQVQAGQFDTTEVSFARLIADQSLTEQVHEFLLEARQQLDDAREGLVRGRERGEPNQFGIALLSAF